MVRKLYDGLVLFFAAALSAGPVFAQKTWYETDPKVLDKLSAIFSAEAEVVKNAIAVNCSPPGMKDAKRTGICEVDKEEIQAFFSLMTKTRKTIESQNRITTTEAFFIYLASLNIQTTALHLFSVSPVNSKKTTEPFYAAVKNCEAPVGAFVKMTSDMIEEDDRLLFESRHSKKILVLVE
jgi:hypothetical protein